MRPAGKHLFQLLSLLVVVVIFVILAKKLELHRLLEELRQARWEWVALAAVANVIINNVARTKRFAVLLTPLSHRGPPPGFGELFSILMATRALNSVFPARSGETLRAVTLSRRYGYSIGEVAAALLIEPILDVISLAIPAVVLLLVVPPPPELDRQFEIIGGIGAAMIFAAIALGLFGKHLVSSPARRERSKLAAAYSHFMESIHLMNSPRVMAKSLAWTAVSILIDLATIGMCLAAVNLDLSIHFWIITLIVVNATIAIPATPGSVGLLEAGAVLALGALGVDQNTALVFAVFYHGVHLIPDTLVGAVTLVRQWTSSGRSA